MPSVSSGNQHPIQVGVIGCGYWGKNLVRNFAELGALRWVCDSRQDILASIEEQYSDVQTTQQVESLWSDSRLDAVVIATPSSTHAGLAIEAIKAGKHVYIEKPMASTIEEAEGVLDLAKTENRQLMIGHLLMYHPAFNSLKHVVNSGQLGILRYLQSDRLNWNWPRADKNVMWDLMPHDFSVLLYLSGQDFVVNQVIGHKSQPDGKIDTVQVSLKSTSSDLTAMMQASWVFPKKQVQCLLVGSEANAILDDTVQGQEKLKVLAPERESRQWLQSHPEYFPLEPLKLECLHFLNTLEADVPGVTNGENGLAVVRLLEQAQQKLNQQV